MKSKKIQNKHKIDKRTNNSKNYFYLKYCDRKLNMTHRLVDLMEGNSSKDFILAILSKEFPLTSKQIFNKVKLESKKQISYQAVHKVLQEMVLSGILSKENALYQINSNWINQMKKTISNLETMYKYRGQKIDLNTKTIEFDNLWDLWQFILWAIGNNFLNTTSKNYGSVLCKHMWHYFPTLFYSKEEFEKLMLIVNNNSNVFVSNSNYEIDKWIAGFYEKIGWPCVQGKNVAEMYDTIVHGDALLNIFFPDDLEKAMEKNLKKIKSTDEVEIKKFLEEVIYLKTKIVLTIERNPQPAKKIY